MTDEVLGADPFLRLFRRDTLWIYYFGRMWLPLGQLPVLVGYSSGLGVGGINLIYILVGSLGLWLGYRVAVRHGHIAGWVMAAGLLTDPDLAAVMASPYQEAVFIPLLFMALLLLQRAPPSSVLAGMPLVLTCAALCLTRYEGAIASGACALVLLIPLGATKPRFAPTVAVGILLAILASCGLVAFETWGRFAMPWDRRSAPVGPMATHVWNYLTSSPIQYWLLLAAPGLFRAFRPARRDLIALHVTAALFLVMYLTLSPYLPPGNRRFHIIPALWIYLLAGLGAQWALEHVATRWPRLRYAAAVSCAVLVAGLAGLQGVGTYSYITKGFDSSVTFSRAAAEIEAEIGPKAPFGALSSATENFSQPAWGVVRIAAFMEGMPSRVRLSADPAAFDAAELAGVLVPATAKPAVLSLVVKANRPSRILRLSNGAHFVLFEVH